MVSFFPGTVGGRAIDPAGGASPPWSALSGAIGQETRTTGEQFQDFLASVFPGTALSGWGQRRYEQMQPFTQMAWQLGAEPEQRYSDWLAQGTVPTRAELQTQLANLRNAAQIYGSGGTPDALMVERLDRFDTPEAQLNAILAPLTGLGGVIAPGFRRSFQRAYADPVLAAFRTAGLAGGEGEDVTPGSFLEFVRQRAKAAGQTGFGVLDASRYQ
jgi:hypothetical protein